MKLPLKPTSLIAVSIHAPVMDAKCGIDVKSEVVSCFNPRARDGRERRSNLLVSATLRFNPRARDGREDHA